MGAAKHPIEGGAGHEERTARGTTTVRTPHAMEIVACLAAGLVLAGCGNVAKTARPEGVVAASQADPNLDLTITVPPGRVIWITNSTIPGSRSTKRCSRSTTTWTSMR